MEKRGEHTLTNCDLVYISFFDYLAYQRFQPVCANETMYSINTIYQRFLQAASTAELRPSNKTPPALITQNTINLGNSWPQQRFAAPGKAVILAPSIWKMHKGKGEIQALSVT